jgi:tetratricopeptide (TPR) repeat protein
LVVGASVVFVLGLGCASHAPDPRAPSRAARDRDRSTEVVRVPRTVIAPGYAASIEDLYQRAQAELDAGRTRRAALEFDRVYSLDPDGDLAGDALFQAAASHDASGDRGAAVSRYERLARRFPDHSLSREALVRTIRLLAFLERWQRAAEVADLVLSRYADFSPIERVVTLSGKALGLIAMGNDDKALYFVEKGRTVVEEHQLDAAGRLPRDVGQLYFALGEVRRLRAARIRFSPVPDDFAAELERRCQLLLDAQSAYSNTMRAYDAHWSAMAGFRVGELYQSLHADLMQVPAPATATNERKRQLFEGAMRLRYSILLRKALTMMEHTLAMAERTNEQSSWVERAREAKDSLVKGIEVEERSIDRLPYSRDELQAALDRLGERPQTGR